MLQFCSVSNSLLHTNLSNKDRERYIFLRTGSLVLIIASICICVYLLYDYTTTFPGKGVATSPTPWCRSYRKGSLRITLDYGRQLHFIQLSVRVTKAASSAKLKYYINYSKVFVWACKWLLLNKSLSGVNSVSAIIIFRGLFEHYTEEYE